ncbi:aspartate carbamoyltransferase [Paraburkholderia sp. MMS20-SJTR3]|uniref:Aspartate carbamoyltransferase n=1 Tax=Paraburkholderia sejongensis TaxID=2886946 RepID=A0ABS8JSS0_9BURK|nr:aspartate carbamoyltransferase [Paraburkholderia sp. MMS20-SJTR3]MCC8392799.1 aspartate carbamoyltransferase [Paraburkholderia sp. MMS20-SJTR3]
MKPPSATVIIASACILLGTTIVHPAAIAGNEARQKQVVQQGTEVMPFSIAATTHIFTKTANGGIQQVVTKHPAPEQVAMIREHLTTIAKQFSAGNFAAPEKIHGENMPGLAALRTAKPGELEIRYRDLPNGGEIEYRTHEPRLVTALHEWFDAQLSDHGHDAMAGHDPGMMHHHSMDAPTAN